MIDYLYSPPDHDIPASVVRHTEREEYRLQHTTHSYLSEGEVKPNPAVLLDIISGVRKLPAECVYLGDSKMKDVAMAQDAGVTDVLAAYGGVQH